MQDIRLYINDTLVDLPDNVASQLRLSKGGADVSNIESRTADQSYTITLPFTRVNDALFQNADIQTTGKFFAPSPYRARLEAAGAPLLTGGWRLNAIKGGYVGLIYSEEVDVFALLGEKNLRDITTFKPVAFQGQHGFEELLSLDNRSSDLCFPLVAYGNFFAPANSEEDVPPSNYIQAPLEIDDYTPSVWYVNVLKHIFENIGWRAGGEPLEDTFFSQLCLPYVGEEYLWNWRELLKLEAARQTPVHISFDSPHVHKFFLGSHHHYFPLEGDSVYNPAGRYRGDNSLGGRQAYFVRKEGGYLTQVSIHVNGFSWPYSNGPKDVHLALLRLPLGAEQGADDLGGLEVLATTPLLQNGAVAEGLYTLTLPAPVFLEETHRLLPVIRVSALEQTTSLGPMHIDLEGVAFSVTPGEEEIGPLTIDIAANLPDLNQREFVKSFLTLGNLRFNADPRRRTITFYYHDRYQLSADFAIDLTGSADSEACEFVSATAARHFQFKYSEDSSDAQIKGFADLLFDTRNANAEGSQGLQLPFAGTMMRDYRESGNLIPLPCIASQDQLDAPLNTVSWSYGYTPRLLRYEGVSTYTLPMAFIGGRSLYGRASFAGLSWPELYERHYRGYIAEIVKGHLLKNSFALTPDLYRQLSPAKPVLFNGILYRLNKVQGYRVADPGALADIELLRIVQEAVGGGKPAVVEEQQNKEFYDGEFYASEWY